MIRKLISFIRRKVFRIGKYRWDYQYSTGRWDGLRTTEMQRLNVARVLLRKYTLGGNILEIGCGEGVFFKHALGVDYAFYEGLDLSEVAISRIPNTEKSLFLSADMEIYVPTNNPFSVIVLNEVLYYSKNPLGLLKRYTQYLAKDGVFLIGMYDTKKSTDIWISTTKVFSELDSVKVKQDSKVWYYKILKMN
jgi:2-polyprenyl-6-hydroxyphenyl methylase/3-demethylubiquinone-9 3-methyltransferase